MAANGYLKNGSQVFVSTGQEKQSLAPNKIKV